MQYTLCLVPLSFTHPPPPRIYSLSLHDALPISTHLENVTARRKAIVVTELPYQVGPERVIEKIKEAVDAKKLQGISNVSDYTDRKHGLRLVIEIKNAFNPEAVLEQLYRFTPMEEIGRASCGRE